ncbi:hypothetical protein [Achromobacter pulmonis]|uniref:hypothetical protein n=1 Tax=Achromobacter pulmonis TaxID=1389932 RepID=UPI0011B2382E|nr:hypothetical protein [Achromobacter pulmonis]
MTALYGCDRSGIWLRHGITLGISQGDELGRRFQFGNQILLAGDVSPAVSFSARPFGGAILSTKFSTVMQGAMRLFGAALFAAFLLSFPSTARAAFIGGSLRICAFSWIWPGDSGARRIGVGTPLAAVRIRLIPKVVPRETRARSNSTTAGFVDNFVMNSKPVLLGQFC